MRDKITLGELKEIYQRAVKNNVTSVFIGETEVYVKIIGDILADMSSFNTSDDTIIEVSQTNIFDER